MTAVLLTPDSRTHPGSLAAVDSDDGAVVAVVVAHVTVFRAGTASPVVDRHLRTGGGAPRPWRMAADVLVTPGGPHQASTLARHHPGALVVAAFTGPDCWVRLGAGPGRALRMRKRAASGEATAPREDLPWPLWASLVHTWLVAGLSPQALTSASACVLPVGEPSGAPTVLIRPDQ
ncbi:hypothetical protein [Streptomyces sp. HNM1019]|uniref:hypothetical protein n=1 Tax=Streptomyces sp. HNM1019 TaxID=3424717 RepID=UPI003D7786D3